MLGDRRDGEPRAPSMAVRRMHRACAYPRPCPVRRRVLQGQDHRGVYRHQRRRRLRRLCAHPLAPHGQAHSRQSGRRAEEHGRRRRHAARQFPLQRRAQGRHGVRHLQPRHRASIRCSATRRRSSTPPSSTGSARPTTRSASASPGTRPASHATSRCWRRNWWSAHRAPARTPTSFPRSPTACSAPSSRSSPAIPAATTSISRWSARRCRAAAAGRGRA